MNGYDLCFKGEFLYPYLELSPAELIETMYVIKFIEVHSLLLLVVYEPYSSNVIMT